MVANNELEMIWPPVRHHQNICLQTQKRAKKSVNNSVSLTELFRITTHYKSFASHLEQLAVLCRSESGNDPEIQALSTNINMKTIVFFKPTLYIVIKCDLLIVFADEYNTLHGSTHTIKKNTEA
jgi:hypothetical protein